MSAGRVILYCYVATEKNRTVLPPFNDQPFLAEAEATVKAVAKAEAEAKVEAKLDGTCVEAKIKSTASTTLPLSTLGYSRETLPGPLKSRGGPPSSLRTEATPFLLPFYYFPPTESLLMVEMSPESANDPRFGQ